MYVCTYLRVCILTCALNIYDVKVLVSTYVLNKNTLGVKSVRPIRSSIIKRYCIYIYLGGFGLLPPHPPPLIHPPPSNSGLKLVHTFEKIV